MTEPSPSRPVPGPPPAAAAERTEERPAPAGSTGPDDAEPAETTEVPEPFADLDRVPVADHVAVFEAEHSRLQDELSTIDQV
jgi:hypothetical protein